MNNAEAVNDLYFVVMPQISLSRETFGKVDSFLTLLPNREMASEFSKADADSYMRIFTNRKQYFTGDNVIGYDLEEIPTRSGFCIVKVAQHVRI